MDERPDLEFTFREIQEAAHRKQLIALLKQRLGHVADFSLVKNSNILDLDEMENRLSEAAGALEGCEAGKVGVEHSGLCLVQAIVLEAIQQQLDRPSSGSGRKGRPSVPPLRPRSRHQVETVSSKR